MVVFSAKEMGQDRGVVSAAFLDDLSQRRPGRAGGNGQDRLERGHVVIVQIRGGQVRQSGFGGGLSLRGESGLALHGHGPVDARGDENTLL